MTVVCPLGRAGVGACRALPSMAMDDGACPTCGKPLGMVDVESRHVDQHGHGVTEPPGGEQRFPRTAVLAVFAAVAAAVVGLFALTGGTADDPATEVGVPDQSSAGDGTAVESTSVRFAEELSAATETLTAMIGEHRLAYAAEDGVVVIELGELGSRAATRVAAEVAFSNDVFFDLGDYELLNEGNSTFAIDRNDSRTVFELATIGPLVRTSDAFSIGKNLNGERDAIVVATAAGFWMTWVDLPVGSSTIPVPDLGVLVLPPTGGTLLARPGHLEPFSDHRVIGATSTHHVEVRCDDELHCVPVLLERDTTVGTSVPDVFAAGDANISISPDGRWIVLIRNGPDLVLQVSGSRITEVDLTDGSLAWGPDGSFIAWLPPGSGEPVLSVYQLASGDRSEVDLAAFGGPESSSDAIVVFR